VDARSSAGDRLQNAFALTRGGSRYEMVTTGGCVGLSEFQATLCVDAEVVWLLRFSEEGSWSRHNVAKRNPPAQETP